MVEGCFRGWGWFRRRIHHLGIGYRIIIRIRIIDDEKLVPCLPRVKSMNSMASTLVLLLINFCNLRLYNGQYQMLKIEQQKFKKRIHFYIF